MTLAFEQYAHASSPDNEIVSVISEFNRLGFATFHPRGPLYDRHVREARSLADEFSASPPAAMPKKWRHESGRMKHLVNPHWNHTSFRELITCPEVAAVCAAVLGPVAAFVTHSKISYKVKGCRQVWLPHQDKGYASRKRAGDQLSFAVYLEDCDDSNGTLCFVPESHKGGTLPHEIVFVTGENEPQLRVRGDATNYVSVSGRAGDIAVFHGDTIHMSGSNTRGGNRCIFIFEIIAGSGHPFVEGGGRDALIINPQFGMKEVRKASPIARVHEAIAEYVAMPAAKRLLYWSSVVFNRPRRIDPA